MKILARETNEWVIGPWLRVLPGLMMLILAAGCDSAGRDWNDAARQQTVEAYRTFLERHPDGDLAARASAAIDSLEWTAATGKHSVEAYVSYLQAQGNGRFRARADSTIRELRWAVAHEAGTVEGYRSFVAEHPDGYLSETAEAQLEALEWAAASTRNTIQGYRDYVAAYPEALHASEGHSRIRQITANTFTGTVDSWQVLFGLSTDGLRQEPGIDFILREYPDKHFVVTQSIAVRCRLIENIDAFRFRFISKGQRVEFFTTGSRQAFQGFDRLPVSTCKMVP